MEPGLDDDPRGAEDEGRVEDVDSPGGLGEEVRPDVHDALDERAAGPRKEGHAQAGEVDDCSVLVAPDASECVELPLDGHDGAELLALQLFDLGLAELLQTIKIQFANSRTKNDMPILVMAINFFWPAFMEIIIFVQSVKQHRIEIHFLPPFCNGL